MKLLLFSDIHANRTYCERICELSENVDAVIGAGDFGIVRNNIKQTIDWLTDIKKPTFLVPGNAESHDELDDACRKWPNARVLHGSGIEHEGIMFYGIGGGIPVTPFGSWSFDFTEEEANGLLSGCPEKAILISHSPPFGLLDVSSQGQHLGSKALRMIVEERNPLLVVCGHIHESAGKLTHFSNTVIVNAGPKGLIYYLKV